MAGNRLPPGSALSGAGLVLSSPLWALITAAITIDSPGPVFYTQARVGEGGRGQRGRDRTPARRHRRARSGADTLT